MRMRSYTASECMTGLCTSPAVSYTHLTAHKGNGDAVKKGDLLISVDLEAVKAAGYDVITPMVVCNLSLIHI